LNFFLVEDVLIYCISPIAIHKACLPEFLPNTNTYFNPIIFKDFLTDNCNIPKYSLKSYIEEANSNHILQVTLLKGFIKTFKNFQSFGFPSQVHFDTFLNSGVNMKSDFNNVLNLLQALLDKKIKSNSIS
jgi:hypothetical protein